MGGNFVVAAKKAGDEIHLKRSKEKREKTGINHTVWLRLSEPGDQRGPESHLRDHGQRRYCN